MSTRKERSKLYKKLLVLIGKRIKELRIAEGYTNADIISYKSDISRQQWRRYEGGHDFVVSTLLHILVSLNIDFKEFFTDELNEAIKEYMDKQ
jgi:transcriptional regulator with XRE-family HTH domain